MSKQFDWAIIGAGPAGIAAIGKLLDSGIAPDTIAWIDPEFSVGDFGAKWHCIPSNTKAGLFTQFLLSCNVFNYKQSPDFSLKHENPERTCQLKLMAEPLQWVTDHLKQNVDSIVATADRLSSAKTGWFVHYNADKILAKNVVLAVGSVSKTLSYAEPKTIPLDIAMSAEKIVSECQSDDVVAVFGSSHSAILAIRNLAENTNVKKIINFYRSPLRYAVYMDDWILYDDTGLKGTTAQWAKEKMGGELPISIERVLSNDENIEHHLPACNKAVYAVGFERRHLPTIDSIGQLTYCDRTGIIAPGLFGVGIAFPERKENPLGISENRVGLWKFMDYLNRVVPVWMRYSSTN